MKDEIINRIAAENELAVQRQFEKLKYSVERLDRKKKRARPDFLVSRSGRPQMLCEVKTIVSAGYMHDKGVHISTLDENLRDFHLPIDLRNITDDILDAVRKRAALVADEPKFAPLSLLVAFFFDQFAKEYLHCYPRTFDEDVSGILTIETDVARTKAFAKLSREEQRRRLRTGEMAGLPPPSKDFALVRNKAARRKLSRDFQDQCITEPYDASL